MQLGSLYESQQRWIEALAVYRSPNIEDRDNYSAIDVGEAIVRVYEALGNSAQATNQLNKPSIRTKAVSRTNVSCRCF